MSSEFVTTGLIESIFSSISRSSGSQVNLTKVKLTAASKSHLENFPTAKQLKTVHLDAYQENRPFTEQHDEKGIEQ